MKFLPLFSTAALLLISAVRVEAADAPKLTQKESEWLDREVNSLLKHDLELQYRESENAKLKIDVQPTGNNQFALTATVLVGPDRVDKGVFKTTLTRRDDGTLHMEGDRRITNTIWSPRTATESVQRRTGSFWGKATKTGEHEGHATVVSFNQDNRRVSRYVVSTAHGFPLKGSRDMTSEVTQAAHNAISGRGNRNVKVVGVTGLNKKSVDVQVTNLDYYFGGRPQFQTVRVGLTESGRLSGSARVLPESKSNAGYYTRASGK